MSLEFEGTISASRRGLNKRTFRVQVHLYNNSKHLCEEIQRLTGMGKVYPTRRDVKKRWQWNLTRNSEVKCLLPKIIPFLSIKKKQAELALKLLKNPKDSTLAKEIQRLNQAGPQFDLEWYLQDRELPTETIHKLATDPVYFIEKLFPIELYDYQKVLLRSFRDNQVNLIEKGRQLGCSFACACFALWYAATHANHRVLILALYKKQAQQVLGYVKEILWMRPEVREELIQLPYGDTRTALKFINRSEIECSNCSKPLANNVRSKVAHLLFVDEAILLYDRMLPALEPVTAFTHGREVWLSTVGAEGCSFHAKVALAKMRVTKETLLSPDRSEVAKVLKTPDEVLFYMPSCSYEPQAKDLEVRFDNILCPNQTPKRLQRALETLKTIGFKREYTCEWLGQENSMFPVIYKWGPSHDPYPVESFCWAGLDVGEVQNPTVLTIIRGDAESAKVVKTKAWKRAPSRKRLAKWIHQALKSYKPREIRMDKTGIGAGLYERVEELGLPLVGVSWNRTVKNQLMFDLKDALTPGILRVREDMDQLLFELRGYYGEPVEGANIFEFHAIDTDDYVDSLALAWAAVPKWGYIKMPEVEARERRVL